MASKMATIYTKFYLFRHSVGSFVMKYVYFLVKAKTRLILLEYDINIRKNRVTFLSCSNSLKSKMAAMIPKWHKSDITIDINLTPIFYSASDL